MEEKKLSSDGVEWAYNQFIKGKPEREASFREAGRQAELSQQIYDIRHKLGLTREQLAELSGLTSEAIEDLEEADYDGSWEEAIQRVNSAFQQWFETVIIPASHMTPDDYSVKVVNG
jgi:DNA-binding XRE family transcriptional regulator